MRECACNPASAHFKRLNQLIQIYEEENKESYSLSREREMDFPLFINLTSSDALMSRSGSDRLKEGEVGVSPSIQLNQQIKEIPEKVETNKETEITEVEVNPQIQPNQQIKESNKETQMIGVVNNFCIFLFVSALPILQVIREPDKIIKTSDEIIFFPETVNYKDPQTRNQDVYLNKELILNEKKQDIREITLVPPEPLTIENSSWSVQQITRYLLTMLWPVLVFILTIMKNHQSIMKVAQLSFISMYNNENEGLANSNESWIYKINERFKFIFGPMEASIMLCPNYEKPKDAYASSKWPNKDRTTLNHNTYPNSTILNENVIASGIFQIILLEKETSVFVNPFKSNQPMEFHDGHCEAPLESQMNSRHPRAQLRKEVRRPRTRHKPAEFRLLHQLFKPIRPRIQEEDQMKRFILYYIAIIFS